METRTPVNFFLGANTPEGFFGYHHELIDGRDGWRGFLIKSGPGSGKSTLMKQVEEEMRSRGLATEALYCSSDPHSLDGVVVPAIKTVIFDATAPHILEPRYWGAVEQVVDLSHCMDADKMYPHQRQIIELTDQCAATHGRVRRYMSAAADLMEDSRRLVAPYLREEKIARMAARLAKEFPAGGKEGKETRRFLSAVTPQGVMSFSDTISALCPKIFVIEDEVGAAAIRLMEELRHRALDAGGDVITCACPFAPRQKIDHLLMPEWGLGFTIANGYHPADFPVYRRIHAARFFDTLEVTLRKEKLAFNRKAAKALIGEAVNAAAEAKQIHDRMEEFSQAAMDWDGVSAVRDRVLAAFIRRAENA